MTHAFLQGPGIPDPNRPKLQIWASICLGTPKGQLIRFDDYAAFNNSPNGARILASTFPTHDVLVHGESIISVDLVTGFY